MADLPPQPDPEEPLENDMIMYNGKMYEVDPSGVIYDDESKGVLLTEIQLKTAIKKGSATIYARQKNLFS